MDTLDLIAALADMAGILRGARVAGAPMPIICLGGHSSARFTRWGSGVVCCACGRRPLPADALHSAITRMLRAGTPIIEEEAA